MEKPDAWLLTENLHVQHGQADPFSAAIRATRMPMIVTDPARPDNPIIFANDAFLELTGYSREEVNGRNCRFLQGPDTDQQTVSKLRHAIAEGRDISIDILNYRKDGTSFWNALYLSPVHDANGVPQYFFASQLNASARKSDEATMLGLRQKLELRTKELEDALAHSNLLLHEVDHRVKNNLQMICAMITLQSFSVENESNKKLLNVILERIEAISAVHKQLYNGNNIKEVDLAGIATDIANNLVLGAGRDDIKLEINITPAPIRASSAASAALVLNEVITNALKHGFPAGRGGVMRIGIEANDGACEITVQDQGPGMPNGTVSNQSFGKTLIKTLVEELKATIAWIPTLPGTLVRIRLPLV